MNAISLKQLSADNPDALYVLTIGGCGEFGMNMTAYATKGYCILVDCGLVFSEPFEIGIDAHIPSPEGIESVLGGPPDAFLITHGHEDHLGALPFFLPRWNIPVYLGPWANELLKDKLSQRGDSYEYAIHLVHAGTTLNLGPSMKVEWIHVPHSIPHCCSLVISSDQQNIFHTGDFKLTGFGDIEPDLDISYLKHLRQKKPITALISDSTNSLSAGVCPSERTTFDPIRQLFSLAEGVTFLTTFSSNIWRIKTVLMAAQDQGKKVLVFGAGMRKALELGTRLNLLKGECSVLVDEQASQKCERKNLVVLISGCQGEYRSGMFRLVHDEISFLRLKEGDQVIFSSRTIPGNEKSIAKIMSLCHQRGAAVFSSKEKPGIHVSGHAHSEDLRTLWNALEPKFHVPVHGTFTQLAGNQALVDESRVVPVANGTLIAFQKDSWKQVAEFDIERLYVDSWSRQLMNFETMRARHKIGDSGLAIVSGFIAKDRHELDIEFIGMPFQNELDQEKSRELLLKRMISLYEQTRSDANFSKSQLNEQARQLVRKFLTDRYVKKPVVFSKISLVGDV